MKKLLFIVDQIQVKSSSDCIIRRWLAYFVDWTESLVLGHIYFIILQQTWHRTSRWRLAKKKILLFSIRTKFSRVFGSSFLCSRKEDTGDWLRVVPIKHKVHDTEFISYTASSYTAEYCNLFFYYCLCPSLSPFLVQGQDQKKETFKIRLHRQNYRKAYFE